MGYLPPFRHLLKLFEASGTGPDQRLTASYEDFLQAIRTLLASVIVDETWYLQRYGDVSNAVASGATQSARRHFIDNGYFEGRMPFPVAVDEYWYLLRNPDVAEDVRRGRAQSGQRHFEESGYREGRLPCKL